MCEKSNIREKIQPLKKKISLHLIFLICNGTNTPTKMDTEVPCDNAHVSNAHLSTEQSLETSDATVRPPHIKDY